jgi:hypothetical protein
MRFGQITAKAVREIKLVARRPSQLRLPRNGITRSGRARSCSHEVVEGERGGGAGNGGAPSQGENGGGAGSSGALEQKDMEPRETRFWVSRFSFVRNNEM